ncbi:MAG: oxidoreductase [Robiginitomaculum sp.]|nr:MAG: oxidoreductase [Robiginitomaculum sp.]
MKLILAGPGAFGIKHLDALQAIDGVEIACIVDADLCHAEAVARRYKISDAQTDIGLALRRPDIDAVILATPTPLHAAQAILCMKAGKHVAVEIPLAENWQDVKEIVKVQKETDLICMVGHTRRYNPSHQWMHNRIIAGEISIQHLDVQTFFFRRTNTNALGQPRAWTDHLMWHHAAHTIDLFLHQTGERIIEMNVMQGPVNPELGIAMDMSIQMKSQSGKLLTLALSFNNDGPLGTVFRYICDNGTYIASYDDLHTASGDAIDVSGVDVSTNGILLQGLDFISAIRNGTQPRACITNVLPCYEVLNILDRKLQAQ